MKSSALRTPHSALGTSACSRRDWLRLSAAGMAGVSAAGWFGNLAAQAAADPKRRRSCILLWMSGGPSQTDTFDLKKGHDNGGPFKEIETAVPGIKISEHLPMMAKQMQDVTIIRSMQTKEGDHERGTYLMRTGYLPLGQLQYPALGALVSKERMNDDSELPGYVSIGPYRFLSPAAWGSGFLGPKYSPLVVGDGNNFFVVQQQGNNAYEQYLRVQNLDRPGGVDERQFDSRLELLGGLEDDFLGSRPDASPKSHQTAYHQAVRMMKGNGRKAFHLDEEPAKLRDAYGRNAFGQGCLLARRLIEAGVPFVEVSLNGVQGNQAFGWDTHQNNFDGVKALCGVLDPGWATLIGDLRNRGLLDDTLVVWAGEFGRTPKINRQNGRDHFPNAWTTVLAGGGVGRGHAYGRTSKDGTKVEDKPVNTENFLATVVTALGLNPMKQNMSNVGRPIRLVNPDAKPIKEILS
jgi:hypothetical protein